MQLEIREMVDADLDEVLAIEQVSVPIPWSRESYQNEIHNQWSCYLVCTDHAKVIGYCGIWNVFEESSITTIVVEASYRRCGAGRMMMEAMERSAREKKAQKIILEVRPSNEPALTLYASLGFIEIARRTAYYPDNQEDALILCKYLDISLEGAVLL